ncbi:MAG: macro domain-containing protein [Selenomonadaceae bacterium]|nr:macro domain-containing protein [Selenomonadaceae bacterium]
MALRIIRADITRLEVDAIVNAANTQLLAGGGVCGAIFRAAGYQELQAACDKLAPIQTGEAVITPGFNLPAKFIIHTAGPIWQGGHFGEEELLTNCYTNSLKLAAENNLRSVAFPLISSGIYGYPPRDAFKVAVRAIKSFPGELDVILTVLDKSLLDSLKAID